MMKKNNNAILNILKKTNAVITNSHIVYTSGKHGSIYINKDAVYLHTGETSKIGKLFADKYKNKNIDIVIAPAVGGTILSQWTAHHLSLLNKKEVLSAYTEKDKGTLASASDSEQIFRRGYDKIVKNKKVLIVEDLTTTGISVKKVVEAVKKVGGKVIAVCVMVNRDPENVTSKIVGAPFSALGILKAEAFEENKCPLCKQGIPINTTVGHGSKYLKDKRVGRKAT